VEIRLATASERNNAGFEILRGRSADGVFGLLTVIPSQGNSSTTQQYRFVDETAEAGVTYWYYPVDVSLTGARTSHRDLVASGRALAAALPTEYALTAYPNPFNPATTLEFSLPAAQLVRLSVHDVTGRAVFTREQRFDAGTHAMTFDGRNLSAGVYFASLRAGSFTATQKLLFVK
jgi:hypothetical protein